VSDILFVLDASVALSWAFEDEVSPYTDAVLSSLSRGKAIVPSIWPLEVGNALVVAERRGRLKEADSTRFLALLFKLPIVVEAEPLVRVFDGIVQLARKYDLSTYDAAYLDLAMRLGIPLTTQDESLRRAASLCGVEFLKSF